MASDGTDEDNVIASTPLDLGQQVAWLMGTFNEMSQGEAIARVATLIVQEKECSVDEAVARVAASLEALRARSREDHSELIKDVWTQAGGKRRRESGS